MFYQTEKLRNNPCVSFVDYSELELTTEFRIQLFNTWKANGKNEIKKQKQDETERNRVTLPGDEKKLDEKERQLKQLNDNPYVSKAEEKWSEIKITMSERFYEDAYPLFPLGINKILEIYGIAPELFSRNTLSYMSAKIFNHDQRPAVSGRKPGPSPQVLEIGFARTDAMDGLIEAQFIEIGRPFDSIRVSQKRKICSWIDGLPRDPQGYYTKENLASGRGPFLCPNVALF